MFAASSGSETKKNQCLQRVCEFETGSLLETRSQFNFCFVILLRQVLFGDTFSLFREVYDSVLTKKKKTKSTKFTKNLTPIDSTVPAKVESSSTQSGRIILLQFRLFKK